MSDVITAGPIQWPINSPMGADGPDNLPAGIWELAQSIAVDWVWALSGRRFGQFAVSFRPEWTIPVSPSPRNYVLDSGYRRNYPVAGFATTKPLHNAPLPGPVVSVTSVTVDGAPLATSAYEVNGDDLIRVDGGQWYAYQDTTLPATDVGTWVIAYVRGRPVPIGGQVAAGVLAYEEALRLTGNAKCRLPNNTSTVQRQGVTVNLDAMQLQQGFTGLREVDQWCRQVNPTGSADSPSIWSPDLDPARLPPIPVGQSSSSGGGETPDLALYPSDSLFPRG